ncbi:hypothetical protein PENSPDRAFT_577822 [Peniophora sp. CONT]|nr:hypothetical protein PENSPDRAFT_577822 [Peniophora sp. CONT]
MPLSYDEKVPYEKQVAEPSLADRISRNKLYLLADSTVAKSSKRKRGDDDGDLEDSVVEAEAAAEDTTYRPNALLITGTPISHLDNDKLFAYAAHYSVRPLGIEWVNDSTCVFVCKSSLAAEDALGQLQRDPKQEADGDGFVTARGIPMSMWPPEERISASLGKTSELRGVLRVRWARVDDVKKRGARRESEFYRKHNKDDRRPPALDEDEAPAKRRRQDDGPPKLTREDLDQELDTFLQQADEEPVEEDDAPISKMYADRVEAEGKSTGKSLLQRTSVIRVHPTAPDEFGRDSRRREPERERRTRGGRGHRERDGAGPGARRGERRPEPQRTEPRPHKTQEELDAELDAFLNDRA